MGRAKNRPERGMVTPPGRQEVRDDWSRAPRTGFRRAPFMQSGMELSRKDLDYGVSSWPRYRLVVPNRYANRKWKTERVMAQTKTSISEKSIWVVEAECSTEKASWAFEDKEVAEWFRDTAQAHYMARCPSCGLKDVLNLQVSMDNSGEVIVSCGYYDCDFAKRIVRTRTRGGQPIQVSSLPGEGVAVGSG